MKEFKFILSNDVKFNRTYNPLEMSKGTFEQYRMKILIYTVI